MADLIKLTTQEELDSVTADMSVEFVSYVVGIDAVRDLSSHMLFKFLLCNGSGQTIHVSAWNEEIQRTESLIQLYNIIHLENLRAKSPTRYNRGSFLKAEFSIQKYTIIENLGKIDFKKYKIDAPQPTAGDELSTIELKSIGDLYLPSKFKTSGYLKTVVNVNKNENKALTQAFFPITDGEYKLDVIIHDYADLDLQKGTKLTLTGEPKFFNNQICLHVKSVADVEVHNEEKKSVTWLLQGRKQIVSKKYPASSASTSKRQRKN